jgi:hypothetical protein
LWLAILFIFRLLDLMNHSHIIWTCAFLIAILPRKKKRDFFWALDIVNFKHSYSGTVGKTKTFLWCDGL